MRRSRTTCIDCTAEIEGDYPLSAEREPGQPPRLCDSCRGVRERSGVSLDSEEPRGIKTTWKCLVEVVFPIEETHVAYRYPGDAEADFAARSTQQVRVGLEKMVDERRIRGFKIVAGPLRCGG